MGLHLNHFYLNPLPYYECIPLPIIESYRNANSLQYSPHILLYGNDYGLNKFYTNQILSFNFPNIQTVPTPINVSGIDIEFNQNSYFLEVNLNTHLNKEKSALIDFIKSITNTKSVFQNKHIIVLQNIDALNIQMQCKLRRIIETSDDNTIFIAVCSKISKLMEPIISRFCALRIPMLDNKQKTSLMKKYIQECEVNDEEEYKKAISTSIKNNYLVTFQDVILCFIITNFDHTNLTKRIKTYQFVKNELEGLFKKFPNFKSIHDATDTIRTVIYKLIHYNLPHNDLAKLIIDITSSKKSIFENKIYDIVQIVTKFDMDMIKINQCKIVHAYDEMFFNLFLLTLHHVQN